MLKPTSNIFITLFIFTLSSCFAQQANDSLQNNYDSIVQRVEDYKQRYSIDCLEEKITDNQGNGYEGLYGTRNFRTILHGVAYRGGGNNYYHRTDKRNNKNDGIQNLLRNGFSTSVYLYKENFEKDTFYVDQNTKDTLSYVQISGNSPEELDRILSLTYQSITNSGFGPVYLHCWNGWHQSGYVAAVLLKQFCGFSTPKSIHYWEDCADNWTRGYLLFRLSVL